MKKTKIVCTMGPNSNDENIMRQLVKEGMIIESFILNKICLLVAPSI